MDTANKIAQLAHSRGLDLVAVGVPKTIDNDVGDSQFKVDRPHAGLRLVAAIGCRPCRTPTRRTRGPRRPTRCW